MFEPETTTPPLPHYPAGTAAALIASARKGAAQQIDRMKQMLKELEQSRVKEQAETVKKIFTD